MFNSSCPLTNKLVVCCIKVRDLTHIYTSLNLDGTLGFPPSSNVPIIPLFSFCCHCMVQFIVIFGVEQYKDVNVIQYLIMGLAASVKNSVFYSIHLFKKFSPIVVVVVVFFFNCVWFWYQEILSLLEGIILAGRDSEKWLLWDSYLQFCS